jgi:PAS domain S-box-containing protein
MTRTSYILFVLMIAGLTVSIILYNKSSQSSRRYNERLAVIEEVLFLLERTEKLKNVLQVTIYEKTHQREPGLDLNFTDSQFAQLDSILNRLQNIVLYDDQRMRIDSIHRLVDANVRLLKGGAADLTFASGTSAMISRAQAYAAMRLKQHQQAFESDQRQLDFWTRAIVATSFILFAIGVVSALYENSAKRGYKKLHDSVKESEERFRLLATSIPQVIWIADPRGTIEYLSDQWQKYTGELPAEGKKTFVSRIHPEDVEVVRTRWYKAVQEGKPWQAEFRLRSADNQYTWFNGYTLPLKDGDGNVIRWIGSASEISLQKETTERLSVLVDERTRELQQSNLDLQRSNDDLQQFAHVISHDLKEPIRKIRMYSDLLKSDQGTAFSGSAINYIAKIEHGTQRIWDMIDGVLRYSLVTTSDAALEPVNLHDVLARIVDDLEVVIREKSATIELGPLPVIKGSPTLLYQLFYNIINNSLKFVRSEIAPHIEVRSEEVDSRDPELRNRAGILPGKFAVIRVIDNGIGFDQQYAEKIFDSFLRLNAKDKYEGTGLGLALCKKIAERHGGFITASGKLNDGATLSVFLPKG